MTEDLEGFAEWRHSIESRVGTLEVTVETEARVRAHMDRDMSDLGVKFGAQERLLKALRATQSDHTAMLRDHTATLKDHTARLTGVETRLTGVETKLTGVETRLTRVESGLDKVNVGIQTIIGLLDRDSGSGDS